MNEELSNEEIAGLLSTTPPQVEGAKKPLKLIRTNTHYPSLPPNDYVARTEQTLRCASRGCSSPTWLTFRGIPYCQTHIIYNLIHELNGRKLEAIGL